MEMNSPKIKVTYRSKIIKKGKLEECNNYGMDGKNIIIPNYDCHSSQPMAIFL